MSLGQWYRLSGDAPDLDLTPTAPGTRYLEDNDPALDEALNPCRTVKEKLRRWLGRRPDAPWRGTQGFPAITEAWNGAAFAACSGASGSMVVFGGGHNDYFGSDVHSFDLASRRWTRISDGYLTGELAAYGAGAVYPDAVYPDGSPLPPHTYDYVQFDPSQNDFILFKGQRELGPDVQAVAIPHMFNLETRTWRHGPKHPEAVLNSGGWTTWDPGRAVVWGNSGDAGGGNAFISFRPGGLNPDGTSGLWGELHANKLRGEADHCAMQIDVGRDFIVVVAHASQGVYGIDPNEPDRPVARLKVSGPSPKLHPYAALEFAENLDAFVYYSAADGKLVYSLEAPTGTTSEALFTGAWTWRELSDSAGRLDPVVDAKNLTRYACHPSHTFGRFRVVRYGDYDVGVLIRHVDTPVYAVLLR